jgi:hypothetical protein
MSISRKTLATTLFLTFTCLKTTACGTDDGAEAAPEVAADGLTQVPLIDGLRMKVPANAKPNRGAAGFYTDDKSWGVMIRKDSAADNMDAAKADAEEMMFTSWIASDATEDGWVLTYESQSMDMDGNIKPAYAFEVVKTLEGAVYTCTGSLADKSGLDAVVESCKTLKRG